MMLLPILAAVSFATDSVYASDALRKLIDRASEANGRVPAALGGYEAAAESELAFVLRESDGTERIAQAEQTVSRTEWHRDGRYEQRVTAYRVRAVGPNISALTYMRQAWTVPMLYGNRLVLFGARPDSGRRRERRRRDTLVAVHPFAADRDRVYRFTGGDIVAVVQTSTRRIPIARVFTHPVDSVGRRTTVFEGEIDLDATRGEIVRMRGRFIVLEPPAGLVRRLRRSTATTVVLAELVNVEIDGRFWLPSYQRIEGQVSLAIGGDTRSIFRVITRFRSHRVIPSSDTAEVAPVRPHRLVIEPGAHERADADWTADPGAFSAAVHADDFVEFAPDKWRVTGTPVLVWRPLRTRDIARYNRVEGAFTGLGGQYRLRDALPGATIAASAGWAWSEREARGEARARLERDRWWLEIAAGRSLDHTNDFRPVYDPGATLSALLFSIDDFDYLDRRFAAVRASRDFGRRRTARLTVEAGPASEWPVAVHVDRGPVSGGEFRPNRGIEGGRFTHTAARLELAPDVTGEFLGSGAGAVLVADAARGDIGWTRLEGSLRWRRDAAPVTAVGRIDAGVVTGPGGIPPQRLFEIGGTVGLSGYGYKEFAGDRAAVARALVMHDLGVLTAPLRFRRLVIPAPGPALAVGIDAGWTDITSDAAAASVRSLGTRVEDGITLPVSRATGGVRASAAAGLRLLGGSLGVMAARPIGRRGAWRLVLSLGPL